MEYLRLYRDFYHILTSPNFSGDSYTLINPVNISLVTKVRGTNQIIEYPTANMESTGIYYTDLTNGLYGIDDVYELNWIVKYTNTSPEKTLITRFKLVPIVIGQNVDIRLNTQNLRLEIC
jgi:hypothetical protein